VGDLAFTIPTLSEPWMGKLSEDEKWMFDYDSVKRVVMNKQFIESRKNN